MGDLPRQINNRTIKAKQKELTPGSGPIEISKAVGELQNTVGWRIILR